MCAEGKDNSRLEDSLFGRTYREKQVDCAHAGPSHRQYEAVPKPTAEGEHQSQPGRPIAQGNFSRNARSFPRHDFLRHLCNSPHERQNATTFFHEQRPSWKALTQRRTEVTNQSGGKTAFNQARQSQKTLA